MLVIHICEFIVHIVRYRDREIEIEIEIDIGIEI